jgi:hypothetical protein
VGVVSNPAGWLRRLACAAALVALAGTRAAADDCYFSQLRWTEDGRRLELVAGAGAATRHLAVDVASGRLECTAPQVLEPVWGEVGRRVLFRDDFGLYELRPADATPAARALLFLPAASPQFLRAYGEDARGRVLVWTFDRQTGEHAIRTLEAAPGSPPRKGSGPEALRAWQSANVARPFAPAGGRFVRSTCLRRPASPATRLCVEQIVDGTPRGLFRVTLGAPGGVRILSERCAPSAFAPSPDSSHVVLGLLEDIDGAGRAAALAAWSVGWQDGRAVARRALPAPRDIRARHETWVRWIDRTRCLWADAGGALSLLDVEAGTAAPLVHGGDAPAHADVWRVVVQEVDTRAAAEALVASLRAAGFEAGIREREARFEVQAGAMERRPEAEARAAALRGRGQRPEVRRGTVEDVAPGVASGHAAGPGGRSAFVRNVDGPHGRGSEIWMVSGSAPERLLVASFTGGAARPAP